MDKDNNPTQQIAPTLHQLSDKLERLAIEIRRALPGIEEEDGNEELLGLFSLVTDRVMSLGRFLDAERRQLPCPHPDEHKALTGQSFYDGSDGRGGGHAHVDLICDICGAWLPNEKLPYPICVCCGSDLKLLPPSYDPNRGEVTNSMSFQCVNPNCPDCHKTVLIAPADFDD